MALQQRRLGAFLSWPTILQQVVGIRYGRTGRSARSGVLDWSAFKRSEAVDSQEGQEYGFELRFSRYNTLQTKP
jgi:hypothetical protein